MDRGPVHRGLPWTTHFKTDYSRKKKADDLGLSLNLHSKSEIILYDYLKDTNNIWTRRLKDFAVEEWSAVKYFVSDNATVNNMEKLIDLTRQYIRIDELPPENLNALAYKIIVHEAEKKDGKRTQVIDIYDSYVDIVNISIAEEIAEHATLRQVSRTAWFYAKWQELPLMPLCIESTINIYMFRRMMLIFR